MTTVPSRLKRIVRQQGFMTIDALAVHIYTNCGAMLQDEFPKYEDELRSYIDARRMDSDIESMATAKRNIYRKPHRYRPLELKPDNQPKQTA